MRLVRSWPAEEPTGHPKILDNCERVYIPPVYDYRNLADLGDDVIHLDWDVAVGREELQAFARKCVAEPDVVRTAPTRAYPTRMHRTWMVNDCPTIWMVWRFEGDARIQLKPGDPLCNHFSFGMVYLPAWTIRGYIEDNPGAVLSDLGFGDWYWKKLGVSVPVEWDVHAVHLNYSMRDALK